MEISVMRLFISTYLLTINMWLLFLATTLACVHSQSVKTASGVKGGYTPAGQAYQQNAGNYNQQYGYNAGQNYANQQSEVGVCYVEVPTASLARDSSYISTSNGSRSDLSRIRSCCSGYIRNIHNPELCDPLCTKECVNALCSAPETCTCFYDHVKNAGGYCVPTCPIGCQNGRCAGGQCICRDGFKLDPEGKYCLPICRDNCGGIGNCTAPNICKCNSGYESTPEGSCKGANLAYNKPCINGDYIGNECRCRQGYSLDQRGECKPYCAQTCGPNGECIAPNMCHYPSPGSPNQSSGSMYNPTSNSYNTPRYPSIDARSPSNFNYTLDHPHSPVNLPVYNQGNYSSTHNYPGYGTQQPYNPGSGSTYYPNGNQYPPTYNISSESQVRPNNQSPYGPGSSFSGPNPYQPYNSSAPSHGNYPPYPGSPSYPNQPGYYPGQPNQQGYYPINSNQPGYNPNQPGYNPNQVNQPGQGSYRPDYNPNQVNQPGQGIYRPDYNPNQVNQPGQGSYRPDYNPNQLNQPGQGSYRPDYRPYQPYQPGLQNQYNSSSPYQPIYPSDQLQNTQCSQPCINGVCTGYNHCNCNPGYIQDMTDPTGSRCIPNCPGGCENGVCSSPNFCICNMGYRKEQGVKGKSRCVKQIR